MGPRDRTLRQKAYPFYECDIDVVMDCFDSMPVSTYSIDLECPNLDNKHGSSANTSRLSQRSDITRIVPVQLEQVDVGAFAEGLVKAPLQLQYAFNDKMSWLSRLVWID